MRRLAIVLAALALPGCMTTVSGAPARCSELVPESWAKGIDPAPLPAFDQVGEVLTAFIDQSARLESANARTRDTITITKNCEAMVNATRPRGLFR